ncbi:MAG: arsinothricin resistance N-acetyltransferase ArsN1 family B [Vicinamibacterales bacterium]
MAPTDAAVIADIYNYYVTDTIVTFEEEPVAAAEIARRIEEVQSASLPWLVAAQRDQVVGYAYATPWRTRFGYRFSAEITVYVDREHGGRGIGSQLYGQLFPMLEARSIHAVMAGIALPNEASVALHEKFGLRKVAHFGEVGIKFNRWIDVGYWQRTWGRHS